MPIDGRQDEPQIAPPFGRRGVLVFFEGMKHLRLESANAPVLVESRDPFSKRGLGLLSFGTFPLQKQRKVHKKLINDSNKLHSNTIVISTIMG